MTDPNSIVYQIKGDITGLKASFGKATELAKQFGSTAVAVGSKLRSQFGAASTAITNIVAPLAAAATAFASFAAVARSFEQAETLTRMSKALGVTTDNLSKLHYVASLSSSSAEEMDAALFKMTRFLGEAGQAGSASAKALAALNLSLSDLEGLSADQAFVKIVDSLNKVKDGGQRAALGTDIFGRNVKNLASIIDLGGKGIKDLGNEGERLGRTMKAIDTRRLMVAKDAMESLGKAFSSLSDRIAVSLAPLLNMVSEKIDKWIGDTRKFDSTFSSMARGVAGAIGLIQTAWQGLQLMWEAGKIAVGGLGVAIYGLASTASKSFQIISTVGGRTWDLVKANFDVLANGLAYGFTWIKTTAAEAFAWIQKQAGQTLAQVGANLAKIPGMADLGDALQAAGDKLVAGAKTITENAKNELEGAGQAVDTAKEALSDAADKLLAPIETDTEYLDKLTDQAIRFTQEAGKSFTDLAEKMSMQEGGNAFTATLAEYDRQVVEMEKKVTAEIASSEEERAVIRKRGWLDGLQEILAQRDKIVADHLKKTMEAEQAHLGEMLALRINADAVNREMIAASDLEREKWYATRAAREYQFHQDLMLERLGAEEELTQALEMSEADRANRIGTIIAQTEKANLDERLRNAALWQSGIQGKAKIIGGILGDLGTLMQSENKKAFEVGKAAALAEATISTILGAQQAFTSMSAIPVVGPALGIAAAGAALAAGFMRVQQIATTQFKGGGSPSAVGGGGAVSAGIGSTGTAAPQGPAQAASSSNVNIALHGQSFSADQVRSLIAAINDQVGDNMNLKTQVGVG